MASQNVVESLEGFLNQFGFDPQPMIYKHASEPYRFTVHFDLDFCERELLENQSEFMSALVSRLRDFVINNAFAQEELHKLSIEIGQLKVQRDDLKKEVNELMPYKHYVDIKKEIKQGSKSCAEQG